MGAGTPMSIVGCGASDTSDTSDTTKSLIFLTRVACVASVGSFLRSRERRRNAPPTLIVTHIFLLWAKDLICLADLAASGGRARDRTCSMKRVVGPRPSSGRLTLGMPDAPTVS